ncbi:DUF2339 domain-containing protein [Enterovibrio norvegicus]|uniref:DUF2339 domain-containing protein n=1 Tax=Enterovibrio norvegicus TaxID=188144 RepID=UPI00352F429C
MLAFISCVLAIVAILVAIKASNRTFRLEKELSDLKATLQDAKLSDTSNVPVSFPRASTSPSKAINPDAAVTESRATPSDESLRQAQYKQQQTIPSHYQAVKPTSPKVASVAHSAAKTPSSPLSDAVNLSKERASTNTLNDLDTVFDRGLRKLIASFQENWLVWVGAIAMLIGGGFLVQVIGSRIEFSPVMRVAIAFTLSAFTIAVGEWFHRREQKDETRGKRASSFSYVPAAITGTGLTGIYCTVIFAFVVYQMLAPTTSLVILAIAAFSSLALSLRQGPLMALLGLVGGYSAPLWIGGTDPNYFLLGGYIAAITLAGTVLMQQAKQAWLAPSIAVPHLLWMVILIEAVPQTQLFVWLSVFLTFTLYVLFAVPRLGWFLDVRYRHGQTTLTHHPVVMSIATVLLLFWSTEQFDVMSGIEMLYLYGFLMVALWLPALRKGIAPRIFQGVSVVVAVSLLILSFSMKAFEWWLSDREILLCLGVSTVLVALRTAAQYLGGDRSLPSRILLVVLAPIMTILTLGYVDVLMAEQLVFWSMFTALVAGLYVQIGMRVPALTEDVSACVHGMLVTLSFVWFDDATLTFAISAQVAVMALQAQYGIFRPAYWAIKVAMSLLVVRLTLLPFIPDWQPQDGGDWSWVLLSYLPSLALLAYARVVLRNTQADIANWFEGAFLHVFLVALFTQTNYWLTGSYGYAKEIDFTSSIVYANQALVMALVYGYRSQFADKLSLVYRGYGYLLLLAFVAFEVLLNTMDSPLIHDHVLASEWPVFNMLTLGWLLPASVLFSAYFCRLSALQISPRIYAGSGLALVGIWLGMSIRHFWQPSSMTIFNSTSMAELFSYSVAGLVVGGVLTWAGVTRQALHVQRVGLVLLACVAVKVFLWDVSSLDGFWRAISFLGLGASLIGLGWLFQKLNKSVSEKPST